MGDKSMLRVGGLCGIVVGILSIIAGVSYLAAPPEQLGPTGMANPAELLASFAANSTLTMIHYWSLAVVPVFGIALNLALTDHVRSVESGLARWFGLLGIAALSIQAANYFLALSYTPMLARRYVQADAVTRAAIVALGPRWIDPNFWIGFGLSGLWLVGTNWLALRGEKLSKAAAWMGIACGISYWLIPLGFALGLPAAVALAAGLVGIILAPIWWIWAGSLLRRAGSGS